MTREIKFRSWLPEFNQMVYGHIGWINHAAHVGDAIYEKDLVFQNLMQFTGLLDRHGNEIYEGDILSSGSDYKEKPSIVKWNNDGAYFHVFRGDTSSGYTLQGEVSRSEIIGNVHENPELLTPLK